MLPIGAPLPGAPPCILHRRFPRTAGDRHGFPRRVLAPQWDARFMGNCSCCIALFLQFLIIRRPRGDGTDNRLSAGVNMDMLDCDALLPLAAPAIEGFAQSGEGPREFARWFRLSRQPWKLCPLIAARR